MRARRGMEIRKRNPTAGAAQAQIASYFPTSRANNICPVARQQVDECGTPCSPMHTSCIKLCLGGSE